MTAKKTRKDNFTFNLDKYTENQWKIADTDLKESLKDWINNTKFEELPTQLQLNKSCEAVTEAFFSKFDRMPGSTSLYYLSNYCLLHTIKNKKKSKFDDDAFLSPSQLHRRDIVEKAMTDEILDVQNHKNMWNPAQQRTTQEKSEND